MQRKSTKAIRQGVIDRFGGRCINCGSTEDLELHHVVPLEIGGNDAPENMVPLCYSCHKAVTNHQLILATAGRKHKAGGRPRAGSEDSEDALAEYVACVIGTAECKRRLGLSVTSALTECVSFKEYLRKNGILKVRNRIDIKRANYGYDVGDVIGTLLMKDGDVKVIHATRRQEGRKNR